MLANDRVIDVGEGVGAGTAMDDGADRVVDRDLFDELLPIWIVDVGDLRTADLFGAELDAIVRAIDVFGLRAIVGDDVLAAADLVDPFFGFGGIANLKRGLVVVLRPGGFPIASGEIGNRAREIVVDVGLVVDVGDFHAMVGGEGADVEGAVIPGFDVGAG